MEHIVQLLKRHGFDEIVVTVAFLANTIRTYFGDGSEFGVRMVYATEETPLGTAGSVRNAMDELDERFLVISGDVLTDIDLVRDRRRSTRSTRRWPPSASTAMENPLEFGIVITREDGSIERFLEKPTWGQVFTDTINTGHLRARAGDLRLHPRGRSVDFSSEVFPTLLADRQAAVRLRVPRATGRTSARSRPTSRPTRTCSTARSTSTSPASGSPRACGWGRAPRSTRRARIEGPAVIGDNCRVEAGAQLGARTPCSAPTCMVRADADLERTVVHDNAYLGRGRAPAGHRRRPVVRPARRRRAARRASSSATSASSASTPSSTAGVKVYPFKTVEAGAIVNRSLVWESRGARSLFGRDGVTGLANVDITPELATQVAMAYGTHPQEGLDGHHVPRLQPGGPHAQAGGDGRAQRGRHQRRRPRGRARSRHPLPGALRAGPGRHHRPAARPATRSRSSSASSTRTAPTSTEADPTQDRASTSTARTSAGCSRATSATSTSRRAPSSTTPPP